MAWLSRAKSAVFTKCRIVAEIADKIQPKSVFNTSLIQGVFGTG